MPEGRIESFIRSAQRRRWLQVILRAVAAGVTVGCILALVVCLLSLRFSTLGGTWQTVAIIAASALVGLLIGLIRRASLKQTALQIDEVAQLKDRVHSALQFSEQAPANDYCRLQLADAERALTLQSVAKLFPWRWSREGTWAVLSAGLAGLAILLVPGPRRVEATVRQTPVAVQVEATELKEQVAEWEQVAEELDSDEMRELTKKLRDMLGDMEHNSKSVEEAMVQLARMSSAVETAAAEFNPLVLQQALQDLAQGLTGLEGFEQIAAQLKAQQYDQASQSAQSFANGIGSGAKPLPANGGLTENRLGQLAEQAQQAGLSDLSQSLSDLQKAIQNNSRSDCQGALGRLSKTLGSYGKRLKIGRAMRSQLSRLNECKQCMGSGFCKNCMGLGKGSCEGGNCKGRGIKLGLPTQTMARSKSPSQSAGSAASMNKFGEETNLRGNRQREHVSGELGAGDSETETEVSPEGQQTAGAAYRKVYTKYQKLSDAVIAEEAVPLAHRQTIKRYFELIHPDRVDPETQLKDVRLDVTEPAPAGDQGDQKEGAK